MIVMMLHCLRKEEKSQNKANWWGGGGGGNRGLKFLSVLFVPSFLDLPLLQQRPNVTN